MHWTKLFIPTLREQNRLLVRAGYMRGRDYLFLGRRTLSRIAGVIRREMKAIGAQEVLIADSAREIATELRSYRQLPQIWFQFARFSMNSYSFDIDGKAFETMTRAIERICSVCGVTDRNPEAIADIESDFAPEEFHTPGQKSIADLCVFTGLPATVQMKSLVIVADGVTILALVRGDHQLDQEKLKWFLDTGEIRPANAEEIREAFGADAGSLGPVGAKVRIICDEALQGRRNMTCGSNRNDYHLRNVTPGEDFQAEFHDLRDDSASITRWRRHASPLQVSNERAELVSMTEGSGEMFLDRLLDTLVEQHHDEDGLALPASIAPFGAVITPVNFTDETQRCAAVELHDSAQFDVLLDDRDERPGVKFKDADLIGIPFRITLGKKLTQGVVEIRDRVARISQDVPLNEALKFISGKIK
jgi:prolyl-tRNA synthetase